MSCHRPTPVLPAIFAWAFSRLTLAAFLVVVGSCGGASTAAPSPSLDVATSAAIATGPQILFYADSFRVACGVDVTVTATGTDTATWVDGEMRLYYGTDRSVPLDSMPVSLSDIQVAGGKSPIVPGQIQTLRLYPQSGAPFSADIELRYKPFHAGNKTATASLDCGPKVPPGTPAPTIDSISVTHASASLQPSDTVTVNYKVTSPVGVWQTTVDLTGPCTIHEKYQNDLQTTLNASVRIPIPAACQLGVPITATVSATDAGLQNSSKPFATQMVLTDVTPPKLTDSYTGDSRVPPVVFDDDSIGVHVSGSDNRAISVVVWVPEPAGSGVEDSLVVNAPTVDQNVYIHVPKGASGPFQLHLFARDATGLVSDTLTSAWNIYPTVNLPAASATVNGLTDDAIPDPRRQLAYLRQPNDNRILVLSLSTMTVTQIVPLPASPGNFDITPGGDSLIVAMPDSGELAVIDLRQTPMTVTLVPIEPLVSGVTPVPAGVSTLANGKVFVSLYGVGPALEEIDLATGTQTPRTDDGNGGVLGWVRGRSLDHSVVFLNVGTNSGLERYDVSTDQFGPVAVVADAGRVVVDSTGQHFAVHRYIYDGSLQLLRQADPPFPGAILPTVLSADATTLYEITVDGTIVRARVSDGAIVDRIGDPISDVHGGVRISDDGSLLILTQGAGHLTTSQVAVIHLH